MIIMALTMAVQTTPPPPPGYVVDKFHPTCAAPKNEPWKCDPIVHEPSNGPHTLIIASPTGQTVTRFDYRTRGACEGARDEVLQQIATPKNPYELSSPAMVFCVPR